MRLPGFSADMISMPGFSAHTSLYRSKRYYRTSGPFSGSIEEAVFFARSLEAYAFGGSINSQRVRNGTAAGACRPNADAAYGIRLIAKAQEDSNLRVKTSRGGSVIPMSEPGHRSFPADSSGCSDCTNNCIYVTAGCDAGVDAGCTGCFALSAIPFVGGALAAGCYVGCIAVGNAACYAGGINCVNGCYNIGSPCCPIDCGVGCCNKGETCLDSAQGLCCSPGLQPCRGPQESCYDPTKETCLPSGVGCAVGKECGNNCCDQYAQCVDPSTGNCCPLLTGIPCGNQCCDGSTERCTSTGCCPINQACAGTCCPPGFICNASNQCVAAPSCQPGQFLCVSLDKTKQNCCAGDQACCDDGSCCGGANNPDDQCCGARGCIPYYFCTG
jgi:hypothetical protein